MKPIYDLPLWTTNGNTTYYNHYKTKDIPDEPLLQLLANYQGEWAFWHNNELSWRSEGDYGDRPIHKLFVEGFPPKLIHSKFKSLLRRGLIGGCDCGCRGDFEITDKGLAAIGQVRRKKYSGY